MLLRDAYIVEDGPSSKLRLFWKIGTRKLTVVRPKKRRPPCTDSSHGRTDFQLDNEKRGPLVVLGYCSGIKTYPNYVGIIYFINIHKP